MTTFTSEDRISSAQYFTDPGINDDGFFSRGPWRSPWPDPWFTTKDYRQTEIEFFYPLTEQIPLGLDYIGCEKPQSYTLSSDTGVYTVGGLSWSTISPQLTIHATNSVGQLNIGGVSIGLEKHPTWYQRVVYKLLGFNWKDR